MSPVKFVHVIKHLEIIDRDISELRQFEEVLANNRTYSDNIRISLELQINSLLNERVKLMELKIQDPPSALQKIKNSQESYSSQKKPFNFGEHEQYYLPRLLAQSETSGTEEITEPVLRRHNYTPKITQRTVSESSNQPVVFSKGENESNQKDFDAFDTGVASLISKRSFPASKREENKDIKSFLKNLPTLDY